MTQQTTVEIENETIEDKQRNALAILWKAFDFNKSEIARQSGCSIQAVHKMFQRGRLSKVAALKLEGNEKLKGVLTKEQMRPDITQDGWRGL